MLRTDVAESLRAERTEDGYLFPDYEGYCFANVPHAIADLFGTNTGRTLPDDALTGIDTDARTVLVVRWTASDSSSGGQSATATRSSAG